jgi:DNA-binding MarR family transcriptional regulator
VADALRRYGVEAGRFGHTMAGHAGMHPTDMAALLAIMEAEDAGDALTAGRLARELQLSTGAVTAVLDRLEGAGHVRRVRDASDRRRVLLVYDAGARAAARRALAPLTTGLATALAGYSPAELATAAAVVEAATAAVRAATTSREGGGGA